MTLKALRVIQELVSSRRISDSEWGIVMRMDEAAALLTDRLRTAGRISWSEHGVLRNAMDKEKESERKKRLKAQLREVDRQLKRAGSPAVQGGLPSLGKRRP
jgi:hypothetical protein